MYRRLKVIILFNIAMAVLALVKPLPQEILSSKKGNSKF